MESSDLHTSYQKSLERASGGEAKSIHTRLQNETVSLKQSLNHSLTPVTCRNI
jgi:hypothetical protein